MSMGIKGTATLYAALLLAAPLWAQPDDALRLVAVEVLLVPVSEAVERFGFEPTTPLDIPMVSGSPLKMWCAYQEQVTYRRELEQYKFCESTLVALSGQQASCQAGTNRAPGSQSVWGMGVSVTPIVSADGTRVKLHIVLRQTGTVGDTIVFDQHADFLDNQMVRLGRFNLQVEYQDNGVFRREAKPVEVLVTPRIQRLRLHPPGSCNE